MRLFFAGLFLCLACSWGVATNDKGEESLKALLATARQQEQQAKSQEALNIKKAAEDAVRLAEKKVENAKRRKEFATDYADYQEIINNTYAQDTLKQKAWETICLTWVVKQDAEVENDSKSADEKNQTKPGYLFWNEDTAKVTVASQPTNGASITIDLGDGVKMEMVGLEPGSFQRGSPSNEINRSSGEIQHSVTLSNGFWMGKYEVTQRQWQQMMGRNPSHFKQSGLDAPVEAVSWDDCQEFIKKLNVRVIGGGFRLPTEAEWEYACRAGTTTPFHYGSSLDANMANFDGSHPYGGAKKGVSRKQTTKAGSFKPNAFGLYDMHGNVGEWCQDWNGNYTLESVTDPIGSTSGSSRVVRGGSWSGNSGLCRSANRLWVSPSFRYYYYGVRVVLMR